MLGLLDPRLRGDDNRELVQKNKAPPEGGAEALIFVT
jgi:hypothetical protein